MEWKEDEEEVESNLYRFYFVPAIAVIIAGFFLPFSLSLSRSSCVQAKENDE